jgi:hypothetical protein
MLELGPGGRRVWEFLGSRSGCRGRLTQPGGVPGARVGGVVSDGGRRSLGQVGAGMARMVVNAAS